MKYYIAYGSNLCIEQMQIRCPDAKPVGTAVLRGWRLVFRLHATIEEQDGIDQKKSTILRLVSDAFGFENSVKLASEANVLLARIDEDLEAFIEQHIEGVNI